VNFNCFIDIHLLCVILVIILVAIIAVSSVVCVVITCVGVTWLCRCVTLFVKIIHFDIRRSHAVLRNT